MCQNRVRKMISERRPPRIQTAEFVLPSPPTSPLHRPLSPMSPPHIDNSITQPRTSVLDRTTTTISTTTPSTSQRLLQQFINTRAERQRNREQSAGTRRRRLDQITSVVNSYRTPSTRPNVSLPRTQPRTTIIPPIEIRV